MPLLLTLAACVTKPYGLGDDDETTSGYDTGTLPGITADTALVPSASGWGTCATLRSLSIVGGTAFDDEVAFARTTDGGFFLRGRSDGVVTLGTGGVHETTFTPIGEEAWFVARYDPDGDLAWAMSLDGSSQSSLDAPVPQPDGGVVVSGGCDGTTVLGLGTPDEVRFSTTGEADLWLARFDAAGHVSWVRQVGSAADEDIYIVEATPDGGFVAVGALAAPVTFGAGEANETVVTPDAGGAWFVARYAADGVFSWAHAFPGSSGLVRFIDAAYHADRDEITLVGALSGDGAVTFGEGATAVTIDPAGDDTFVARYDGAGALLWVTTATGDFVVGSAAAAADDGGAVVSGGIDGIVTFGRGQPGEQSIVSDDGGMWVARYDASGVFDWAAATEGWGWTPDVAAGGGTTLVTGVFGGKAILGAGTPTETVFVSNELAADSFVARYDAEGNLDCALHLATSLSLAQGLVEVSQIVPRADGGWDLAGVLQGHVSFGDEEVDLPTSDLFVATIDLVEP